MEFCREENVAMIAVCDHLDTQVLNRMNKAAHDMTAVMHQGGGQAQFREGGGGSQPG